MITPAEFEDKMTKMVLKNESLDEEISLMCGALTDLGYEAGVKVFTNLYFKELIEKEQ